MGLRRLRQRRRLIRSTRADAHLVEVAAAAVSLSRGAHEAESSQLKFTALVTTSDKTGTVRSDQIMERNMMGSAGQSRVAAAERPTNDKYVLAARITGKPQVGQHADVGQAGRGTRGQG